MAPSSSTITRIELTDAQLHEAWTRLVRKFGWEGSFEEAMEDAVRGKLIRMNALHPAPAVAEPRPLLQAAAAASQSHQPRAPRFHTEPLPGFIDFKRRASGERDDD